MFSICVILLNTCDSRSARSRRVGKIPGRASLLASRVFFSIYLAARREPFDKLVLSRIQNCTNRGWPRASSGPSRSKICLAARPGVVLLDAPAMKYGVGVELLGQQMLPPFPGSKSGQAGLIYSFLLMPERRAPVEFFKRHVVHHCRGRDTGSPVLDHRQDRE